MRLKAIRGMEPGRITTGIAKYGITPIHRKTFLKNI